MDVVPPPAAIVYIPPDIDQDALYAHEGVAHIHRRGYRFAGVICDWDDVERIVDQGTASIVVFARASHAAGFRRAGLRNEFVGEETRQLSARPTNDRVREIIDGSGPIPAGLDPESIAAARRIARRLASRYR